jgi:hypothetical protein
MSALSGKIANWHRTREEEPVVEDASKSLYAYSLIRTLAEGGQDHIDALTPLVVQALATTKQPQTIDGCSRR